MSASLPATSAPSAPETVHSLLCKHNTNPFERLSVPNCNGTFRDAGHRIVDQSSLKAYPRLPSPQLTEKASVRDILTKSNATTSSASHVTSKKNLGMLMQLAEEHLRQHQLPMAISLATLALQDAAALNMYETVAYRLLWVRGLAWYGCRDGPLALQDLRSAVLHAPPAKRALALRCLTKLQHLLDNQQYSVSVTMLTNSEDENTSASTRLRQGACEVSSGANKKQRLF